MQFELSEAVEVLRRTPATLLALLGGLPPGFTERNEGGETWSPRDVLGHLIHGEDTDWIPRARVILEHGESRPFEPFDRFAQQGRFAAAGLDELLLTFARRRGESLAALEALRLGPEQLALRGTHPALGRVSLGELLACWVVHDLDHVYQVARVMAHQYDAQVGPWKAYLRVLRESPPA